MSSSPSVEHKGLLLFNWILCLVFSLTGLQIAKDQLDISNNVIDAEYHFVSLSICVISLIYLLGFYSCMGQTMPLLSLGCITAGFVFVPYSIYMTYSLILLGCGFFPTTRTSNRLFQFNGFGSFIHLLSCTESSGQGVQARVTDYATLYTQTANGDLSTESIDKRKKEYQLMVDSFYDLVTDFYEYGWGQSFHFAPRYKGESFTQSITRAEHFMALKAQMNSTSHVLDMGCGIGGPLRTMAHFTDATIQGITINAYQVRVANKYIEQAGLAEKCRVIQGDFMNLPYEDNTFDVIYAIESLCHAPDKIKALQEAKRVLKPNGILVAYDWVVLGDYDEKNPQHVKLREGIEIGNGLPTIPCASKVVHALESAGLEILENFDPNAKHLNPSQIPWYGTLQGNSWSLKGFRMSSIGRKCTHVLVSVLEWLKIAPKGSIQVSQMLNLTADDLVKAGELGIFTPSYFYCARKPSC